MSSHLPEDPLDADPMLRILREHHPDVDVVVLPQSSAPDPPDAAVATAADLARLAEETGALMEAVVSRLEQHAAWPVDVRRESRWRPEPATGASTRRVRRETVLVASGLGDGDHVALLRAAGNALLELGWQAGPVAGSVPRLVARRGPFSAAALVRESSFQLVITSDQVPTDDADLP